VKTGVKELPVQSFAPTVGKSGGIDTNYASTTASCDAIVGTYAGTGGIFGVTGVMPVAAELVHPEGHS